MTQIYKRQRWRNFLHAAILILGMAAIAAISSWIVFGPEGALWTVIALIIIAILSPAVPPATVMRLYRARPLHTDAVPECYAILRELASRAGLPKVPTLYYIPSPMLNAFTLGNPNNAVIGVTDGILRALNQRELMGVFAHEMSHIAGRDLFIMMLADGLSRLTTVLAYTGLFLALINLPMALVGEAPFPWLLVLMFWIAPSAMTLLQLGLSRAREYEADLNAAHLTGDPRGLASALVKLERVQGGLFERIFMPGRRVPDPSLLRTHPQTEERVKRLLELEAHPDAELRAQSPIQIPHDVHAAMLPPRWRWTGLWH